MGTQPVSLPAGGAESTSAGSRRTGCTVRELGRRRNSGFSDVVELGVHPLDGRLQRLHADAHRDQYARRPCGVVYSYPHLGLRVVDRELLPQLPQRRLVYEAVPAPSEGAAVESAAVEAAWRERPRSYLGRPGTVEGGGGCSPAVLEEPAVLERYLAHLLIRAVGVTEWEVIN